MRARLLDQSVFGLTELIIAVLVITVALLAIAATFSTAMVSVRTASKKTIAAKLADAQMERYAALPFTSIGLDATTLTSTKASDTTYAADLTALNAAQSGTDVSISGCGTTAPQCLPVQTSVGTDNKNYRVETFVRDVTSFGTWTERFVTVIVRDPNVTGSPVLYRLTSGFDKGP
jgi:Tfp pilus assembly protein PilV